MLGFEFLGLSLRLTSILVPVGVYFLVLGLLNSRKHPQLLTGRLDFALMMVAMSPLFVLPVVGYMGVSVASVVLCLAVMASAVLLLSPSRSSWVIYNMPCGDVYKLLERCLRNAGEDCKPVKNGLALASGPLVQVSEFPLLRNVTVRVHGGQADFTRRLGAELANHLSGLTSETSPAAMSMLLVAIAMIVTPLALVANRVPEIVRLIGDLVR